MGTVLLLVGILVGAFINYAIYQFAYFPRPVSPWQRTDCGIVGRVPVLGWLTRWGQRSELGNWFWLRPLLIELFVPIGLLWLNSHVMSGALVPAQLESAQLPIGTSWVSDPLFANFLCLSVLFGLLIVATFIDFDERTIPDLITVPGTCFALVGSVVMPNWRLIESDPESLNQGLNTLRFLHANSPFPWSPEWLQSNLLGLGLGLFFWFGWCFALLNRQWITRRGWGKAWEYFWAIIARDPLTKIISLIAIVGAVGIVATYLSASPEGWESLLSSLFGIGLGGMLVWSFRLVAALVMGKEALGFGDVTLMAMVGAFVGWQVVWMAFFVSPFFALLFVVVLFVLTRDPSTPFGPYLSMGVIYIVWNWADQWSMASLIFLPPALLIMFWGVLLVALALMLSAIEFAKMTRSRITNRG